MQTYNVINNELTGAELPGKIYENLQSLKSDFSGTSFPTENLVAGMSCFRTDQNKIYKLLSDLATWRLVSDLNVEGGASIATQAQAEEGVDNTKVMTPLRTKNAIDAQRPLKTFTTLSSIGLDTSCTPKSIADALPNSSLLQTFLTGSNYPNMGLSGDGVLTVKKHSNGNAIAFEFRIPSGSSSGLYVGSYTSWVNTPWSGWKQVNVMPIATQAEAEVGTDNTTVMTPLRTAQEMLKFPANSINIKQASLAGNRTIADLRNTLDEWLMQEGFKCSAIAFGATEEFITKWNAEAIDYQIPDASWWYVYNIGSYSTNKYAQLLFASYNGSSVYVVVKLNGTWGKIQKLTTIDDFAPVIWNRNNYYRDKNLGTSLTTAQSNAIRNGTFDDIYVGDYWTIGGVVYRIVAIDYYYNCGDTACTTHHVVVVPDTILYSAQMNTSNVTTGAYVGSAMYTSNLANAKTTITNAFGSGHILTIRQYFQNGTSGNIENSGAWTDATVWLMNEINVYGGYIFKSVCNGTSFPNIYTIDNSQYPAFRANPRLIHTRQTYWLRDVADSTGFAYVSNSGHASGNYASNSYGVRPAFCVY